MFAGVAAHRWQGRKHWSIQQMPPVRQPRQTTQTLPDLTYVRPTEGTKLHNYFFDTFGPYPIAGAAFVAGIGQAYDTPPEWKQGVEGFSKRFGSAFGIAASALRRVMGWRKPSGKTRCTTAVSAKAYFHGWVMP